MAILDDETLMLPVLKIAAHAQEHRIGDVIEQLAGDFTLTDAERQQLLPSGKQTTFANRVHWARGFLVQAGLLEATRRAHFRITVRGREVLTKAPPRIDNAFLLQFPEFIEFRSRTREPGSVAVSPAPLSEPPSVTTQTPDEVLRGTVRQIDHALGKELLGRVLYRATCLSPTGLSSRFSSRWAMADRAERQVRSLAGQVTEALMVSLTRMLSAWIACTCKPSDMRQTTP